MKRVRETEMEGIQFGAFLPLTNRQRERERGRERHRSQITGHQQHLQRTQLETERCLEPLYLAITWIKDKGNNRLLLSSINHRPLSTHPFARERERERGMNMRRKEGRKREKESRERTTGVVGTQITGHPPSTTPSALNVS